MAKLIGGSGYDDVQSTAPTSPSVGDTWLDTSTDPPTGKIYADLGGGGQWTTDLIDAQISSRSSHSDPDPNGYIDQAISNAGKTATATDKNSQTEIENGVDSSTTGSRVDTTVSSRSSHDDPDPNGYIDAPVSSAGGVDWSSKTPKLKSQNLNGGSMSASGSGYVFNISVQLSGNNASVNFSIDGTQIDNVDAPKLDPGGSSVGIGIWRFTSGWTANEINGSTGEITVGYVLD